MSGGFFYGGTVYRDVTEVAAEEAAASAASAATSAANALTSESNASDAVESAETAAANAADSEAAASTSADRAEEAPGLPATATDGQFARYDAGLGVWVAITVAPGSGMDPLVYDPTTIEEDVFDCGFFHGYLDGGTFF